MKKLKKIIICSLLITFCLIDKVNAAIGEKYRVSINNDYSKNNLQYQGGVAGGGYSFTLTSLSTGEVVKAYCIDPYMDSPNNLIYVEASLSGSRTPSAYQSVFEQTCGDTSNNEGLRKTALRTVAVSMKETSGRADTIDQANGKVLADELEVIYGAAIKGDASYAGTGGIENINNIVNNAKNSASAGSVTLQEIYSTEQKAVISAYYEGVTIKSFECGEFGGATCTSDNTKEGVITFTLTAPNASSCFGDWGAMLFIEYEGGSSSADGSENESDGSGNTGSSCSCTPRFFKPENGGTYQQLIACEHSNTNSEGTPGASEEEPGLPGNPSGNFVSQEFTYSCSGDHNDDCDPWSSQLSSNPNGSSLCDWDGTTVLEVSELLEEDYDTIGTCLFDGSDYAGSGIVTTDLIFDTSPYKYNGESICETYCIEDYYLELPGPDANKLFGDEEVQINAGTFFTISETNALGQSTLYSKTNVRCYAKLKYHLVVKAIDDLREKSADDYNKHQKYKIVNGGKTITPHVEPVWDTDAEGNPYISGYETKGCWLNYTKSNLLTSKNFMPGSNKESGKFVTGLPINMNEYRSGNSNQPCEELHQSNLNTYTMTESELNSNNEARAIEIDKILASWDECFKWGFTNINNDIYNKKECSAGIEFDYHDGYILGTNPTISVTGVSTKNDSGIKNEKEVDRYPKTGLCSASNCDNNQNENVLDADYNHRSEDAYVYYKFDNLWCNPYDGSLPYLIDAESECSGIGEVIEGFPVSIETPQGKYSYNYSYDTFGHYFETGGCDVGRLSDVTNAFYNPDEKAYTNMCVYDVNNCGTCGVGCINKYGVEDCDVPTTCGGLCKVACVGGGCILDINAGFLVSYRTLSLNDPFPNGIAFYADVKPGLLAIADPGFASTNDFNKSNWNTSKGQKVAKKIEDDAEKIYDSTPEYSIKMDPGTIQDIREYNDANLSYTQMASDGYEAKDGYAIYKSPFINDTFSSDFEINSTWKTYGEVFPGQDYKTQTFTGPALK